ncbi:hypothetical protein CYMTET_32135 [Cymbomonas tetramitiformis]|uniref:Uncharacterized protein n=1 Tax=Cymbomonas tetramitiformis TaxID=36881 RepID=A0AAE0FFE7_9CHLO|nr:hypothetical protein CYMTET_32135 [Cymbomonas tetramitiformis]
MSFPLTLALVFYKLRLVVTLRGTSQILVLIVGAAARTEERLLMESNYWQEAGHLLPQLSLKLCFIGPEISKENHGKEMTLSANMSAVLHRGTLLGFLEDSAECQREDPRRPVVVMGFNPGFGNTNRNLTYQWLPDLLHIAERRLPAAFACANDYQDLAGETAIWKNCFKARYIMEGQRNPFRAITTAHAPGERETGWYTANSYIYAIQGYENDLELRDKGLELPSPVQLGELTERVLQRLGPGGDPMGSALAATNEAPCAASLPPADRKLTAEASKQKPLNSGLPQTVGQGAAKSASGGAAGPRPAVQQLREVEELSQDLGELAATRERRAEHGAAMVTRDPHGDAAGSVSADSEAPNTSPCRDGGMMNAHASGAPAAHSAAGDVPSPAPRSPVQPEHKLVDLPGSDQLELTVWMPGVESMEGVVLDVDAGEVRLEAGRRYQLALELPCKVDTSCVGAKYNKKQCRLRVILPYAS